MTDGLSGRERERERNHVSFGYQECLDDLALAYSKGGPEALMDWAVENSRNATTRTLLEAARGEIGQVRIRCPG